MRRTKILATLGPASARPEILDALIAAGLNAVRLNFSHGTHDWHRGAVEMVRKASGRAGAPLAILADLQGPKIRVGRVKGSGMDLAEGSRLVITTEEVEGAGGVVSTDYEALPHDVERGQRILLDDGKLTLQVEAVTEKEITCTVVVGGVLSSNKGINVPDAALTVSALTDKDRDDAAFALQLGVDYLALSFVRRPSDVIELRALMDSLGKEVPIISKIEKPQALENLDEIMKVTDGVMVARGDLGVEAPLEMIPTYQKQVIQMANRARKTVITATQMLESMTQNPLPTRAEVTDVANAILDGTDVVMLSGETSVGKYPVEAVRQIAAIAESAEEHLYSFQQPAGGRLARSVGDFTEVIASMTGHACRVTGPTAVVVFTRSGRTARIISSERVRNPVVVFTSSEETLRRLPLLWGVVPLRLEEMGSVEEMLTTGERHLLDGGLVKAGDPLIFLFGSGTSPGATNALKIARAGEVME